VEVQRGLGLQNALGVDRFNDLSHLFTIAGTGPAP
jgi:hypothetical protein